MPASERQSRRYDEHLTDAELNELVDGTLSGSELDRAQTHLGRCADCEERYRTLQATVLALHTAPSLLPRRSFQLSPEQAKLPVKPPSRVDRFAEWIVPGLPAIRAATLAVALLLLSVTAIDFLTHRDNTSENAGPTVMRQQESTEDRAPIESSNAISTEAPVLQESNPQDANDAVDSETTSNAASGGAAAPTEAPDSFQANASENSADSDTATGDVDAAVAPAPAAPADSASDESAAEPAPAMAAPQVLASPTEETVSISATASPEATPSSGGSEGRGGVQISRWRLAEIGLLFLLTWLGVSWIGRSRMADAVDSDETSS